MPKTKGPERRNVIFRMEDDSHALLKIAATAEGLSMDAFVNECVQPRLEPYKAFQASLPKRRKAPQSA